MTVPTKPRTYVESPSFTPLPYGLLTTLSNDIRRPADDHWQFGVNYEPVCAESSTTYGDCFAVSGTGLAPVGLPPEKTATTAIGLRGATAFTIFAEVDCSAPGFWNRAPEIIGNVLTQSEQWQVENALWTGVAGGQPIVFPHLAEDTESVDEFGVTLQTAATIVSGGVTSPLDIIEALGLLESELANCYDGVGVIHVPRVLMPAFADASLLVRVGDHYVTPAGNIIVFGAGYRGTAPDGTSSSGSVWMYATGAMFIYQSAPQIIPVHPTPGGGSNSFNLSTNTLHAMMERTYVVGWECCHLAVNVTVGGGVAGSPGSSS